MTLFTQQVRPENICDIIDLTVKDNKNSETMAEMQREGIASLYNILCNDKKPFAYLADDVGMGKTYQALGLAAMVWNEKPDARILFISPRQNLQVKWERDYNRFFRDNYRRGNTGDDRATSVLLSEPLHQPMIFENLRSWARTLDLPERIAPLIRHSSFTRPIFLNSKKHNNRNKAWNHTVNQLQKSGLSIPITPDLSSGDESLALNLTFATELNKKLASLAEGKPYFDLVIVDEAQCLRNPCNQTNKVLYTILKDQVDRWLFMSATPTHTGLNDLPTILNRYPKCKEVALDPKLLDDPVEFQKKLQKFLVRRTRKYFRLDKSEVRKDKYRCHDKEKWKVKDDDMGALETLAVGLVQKGLDKLLQNEGNRYKIGFLSSFESLQSSIDSKKSGEKSSSVSQEIQKTSDFEREQNDGGTETDAPDAKFINTFADEFERKFNLQLPHPKVDSVVKRVAESAFGTNAKAGGDKFLIFTRRVSTVKALKEKLTKLHEKSIEERIKSCWGEDLDWSEQSTQNSQTDAKDDNDDDPEDIEIAPDENQFRKSLSDKKSWLYRYKQTFRGSGRNTLFFEDGWLKRLCVAGNVTPEEAANNLPDCIWSEAWSKYRETEKKKFRFRYIAVQTIKRHPEVFGLSEENAVPWVKAYETILHEYLEIPKQENGIKTTPERDLFSFSTLWTIWDDYAQKDLQKTPHKLPCLPASNPKITDCENLLKRQVIRATLGQIFRLTDTIIDLYFADQASGDSKYQFPKIFLDWLTSDKPGATQLRNDCREWINHLPLIVNNCFDDKDKDWYKLAQHETRNLLNYIIPVAGITGGFGPHKTAVPLFRTPTYPKVIVCTDTLKEGVDLHLFCDQVIHYGVAWTSGDLEQRTGRIDRYFSLIERRLSEDNSPDVKLHVGYPYVESSLELGQVERVIENQKATERLLDSFWDDSQIGVNEVNLNSNQPIRKTNQKIEPFLPINHPAKGRSLSTDEQDLEGIKNYYNQWFSSLMKKLCASGWEVSLTDNNHVQNASITKNIPKSFSDNPTKLKRHKIEWSYDTNLARYVLTISNITQGIDSEFNFSKRNVIEGENRIEDSFLQILVPKSGEDPNHQIADRLIEILASQPQRLNHNAKSLWEDPLTSLAPSKVQWLTDYKANAVVSRGDRKQRICLYATEGKLHLSSTITSFKKLIKHEEFGGKPDPKRVYKWTLDKTKDLSIGYFSLNDQNELIYGNQLIHGSLSNDECKMLIEEVAWRADIWEAILTGKDEQ